MATKTIVVLTDDLEGGEAERTVTFSLDGSHYEIELSHANIGNLAEALKPFINAARSTGERSSMTSAPSHNLADVRTWARDNGFTVSDRGRVSAAIMEAFQQRT